MIRNSAGKLGKGLDIRGEGGYAIVPPSIHPSGDLYQFTAPETEVADAPSWLIEAISRPVSGTCPSEESDDVIEDGRRNSKLASMAGAMRRQGAAPPEIEAALLLVNRRCSPPLSDGEVRRIADSIGRYSPCESLSAPVLNDKALFGLAGDVVKTILPHSEADPVALLLHFLTGYGNLIGRSAHCQVERTHHYANLFFACVGDTAKGRKGTAWNRVRDLLARVDEGWVKERIQSGLSSGEGMIAAVTDRNGTTTDRRLLLIEGELASTLKVMSRDGNTLSPRIREAWDDGQLRTMVRREPLHVRDAHISIVGHITRDELRRYLSATEAGNGFANRFLWARSARSKCLPEGGSLGEHELNSLAELLRPAVACGQAASLLKRDDDARKLWAEVYPDLSDGQPGLLGAVTSRAEAQVLRLSMLYALLECSGYIRVPHLVAALALWDYCEKSARWIFGNALGDPVADTILSELRRTGQSGLTRSQISALFRRHRAASEIEVALNHLQQRGLAHFEEVETDGRNAEVWFIGPECEKSELSERSVL